MTAFLQYFDGAGGILSSADRDQTAVWGGRGHGIPGWFRSVAYKLHKMFRICSNSVGIKEFSQSQIIKLFPPQNLSPGQSSGRDDDSWRAGNLPVADQLHHTKAEQHGLQSAVAGYFHGVRSAFREAPGWFKNRQSRYLKMISDPKLRRCI